MKIEIKTSTLPNKVYWAMPMAIATTLFFFFLYGKGAFWMFFSCLGAYFFQFGFFGLSVDFDTPSLIIDTDRRGYEQEIEFYDSKNQKKKIFTCICICILILLDLFPFFATSYGFCSFFHISTYDGGILVTVLTIVAICFQIFFLIMVLYEGVKSDFENKYEIETKLAKNKKDFEERQTRELEELKSKYGEKIIVEEVGLNKIIFSEEQKKIVIFDKEYAFKDILGCSIIDDSTEETITDSTGYSTTATGNMLKRAIVGDILAGGMGAVAGAATAKRSIVTGGSSVTSIIHNYVVYVNINSLENPLVAIEIGDKATLAHKIAGLFNIIVKRNAQARGLRNHED